MIVIDKEFESLIPPLSPEEFAQLEENCVKEGIRDALVVWPQEDGSDILIDGHNRWKIANKHQELFVNYKRMQFEDRDEARVWIANNQLGRRNLHPLDQERLLSVKREALTKQARQRMSDGAKGVEIFPQAKTRDIIGDEIGVSGRQVDKLHAINEKASEETKQMVRDGKLSVNQAYLVTKGFESKSPAKRKKEFIEQTKKEHEEFTDKKTVDLSDIKEDRKNRETLARDLWLRCMRMGDAIQKIDLERSQKDIDLKSMGEIFNGEKLNLLIDNVNRTQEALINIMKEVLQ